ncbi:MAG TPA: DUF4159 domain-containing protein [Polyangia bacterium]|nr:DUF4159 domain-containing protein [Polyangia bacterium]
MQGLNGRNGRATSRRRFLAAAGRLAAGGAVASSLGLGAARRAFAIGDRSLLRFARLTLPGLPDPRPTALRRLAWEIVRRTSVSTASDPAEIRLSDPTLFRYPFLVLSGDRRFALPPESDIARLRRHITYGGFLLIDSAEGRAGGGFDESVRRLLAQTLPGELPIRVPDSHVLWKSFYVLRGAPGRIIASPILEGVERDRRLAVVYTQNDLGGALARDGFGRWEHEVVPGGDDQREEAFRLAINLVMYALCLDYKTEQAHIDYILRTRRFPR